MNANTLDSDALAVLRALFDLAEVDVRPSVELLGRLLDLDVTTVQAHLAHLRNRAWVARSRLSMTLLGLAVATALPPLEPRPMGPRRWVADRAA